MHDLRGTEDPLDEVAQRVARRYRLICFDEFHISDIADAMILERLLRALFDARVGFIMTSNYHPDDLYPDGLHRDRMLPAIDLLKEHLDIVQVDGGKDYRQLARGKVNAYVFPLDSASDQAMLESFAALSQKNALMTAGVPQEERVLQIEDRQIRAIRRSGRVIWFDFQTLCGGPRSQNDYLELANQFDTVMLSGVLRCLRGWHQRLDALHGWSMYSMTIRSSSSYRRLSYRPSSTRSVYWLTSFTVPLAD